ncbi:MAG TPA: hypothetical protein PLC70_09875, partial [Bacteroidales bacterium]|nr:hypothetical protein [Bacteroidales bacterium]
YSGAALTVWFSGILPGHGFPEGYGTAGTPPGPSCFQHRDIEFMRLVTLSRLLSVISGKLEI